MSLIDFAGRVAVVTGAGRGLGAAYAELLASRGASVLVNDLGTDLAGEGADSNLGSALADRIAASGGIAAANHDDVSRQSGAAAMINQAVRTFGRIDILINNAGVFLPEHGLLDCKAEDFERVWRVHVMGTVHSTIAAFPHMRAQSYGRILNIGSTGGYFGAPGRYEYCTAKGGIHGFTMTFADEARPWGITANVYCPGGFTRPLSAKAGSELEDAGLSVALAAPLAVWLSHEDCRVSGQIFESMCGQSSRIVIGLNEGHFARDLTLEEVAAHFGEIRDAGAAASLAMPDIAPQRAAALMAAFTNAGRDACATD